MYPIENGRRYHAFKSGAYPLPNDEEELERLNVVHNMVKTALGDKLYLAPISDFGRVLDIGTGTGCWAIEMGDLFPQAEFLGNDLSPVQPTWVPPNVRFEVDDVESGWVYGAPQDFIFCRNLNFAVSDFPRLAKQAFDNVRPGGWVEFQDFDVALYSEDDSYHPSSDLAKYMQLLMDSARKAGKEPRTGPKLEQWVRDAGFQNITHQKFKLPLGLWPKDKRQVRPRGVWTSVHRSANGVKRKRSGCII
jgi:SAM-dependent methyltransferase